MTAPARILVVDDDATARILMRAALHKAGYEVALASGGTEALRRFDEQRFDMVMLDVEMPDINGLEVCATLRQKAGDLLPIVMVTGRDDVQSVEKSYESGATDFIAKPINWALIGHRVRYQLRAAKAQSDLRASHARNAAILDAIPDTLFRVNGSGLVLDARDRRGVAASGPPCAPGGQLAATLVPAIADRLSTHMNANSASGAMHETDFSLIDEAGQKHFFETRLARIDSQEALCLVRDITARKQAEAALIRSQDKLQQAQAVARLGTWYVNLDTDAVEWSTQTYRIYGVPEGTPISNRFFFSLVHPDDLPAVQAVWERALLGEPYTLEYRVQPHGRVAWLLEKAELELDEAGRVRCVFGTVQDITERKETENRIARLAYVDSLTGLPNRESFLDRLGREVQRAGLDRKRLAILFMDLDGFKTINDTLGHHTGDLVLQAAADRLRAVIRPSDMVSRPEEGNADLQLARLGGDEFTALIRDVSDPADVLAAAQRIGAEMRRAFTIGGRELLLTASIGIAVYPDDGEDVPTLLKHADTAMYHAKEQGRDNCQFYSAGLTQRALDRMNLERDLRLALEQGQFHLAYQPQVDARNGTVNAVEALIRWSHPLRGAVAPLDFIALAESNGLILPIGEWVLREACAEAARWQHAGRPVRIAVNLSAVQLKDAGLLRTVTETLARTGLAPHLLELEVTESALMDDSEATLATMQALRAAGVRIALDDFGTGYSSLSYLKRMPLSTLKVDRSFVMGLPQDKESASIVRAIVSIAKTLGYELTAEGVETPAQARVLTDMGCDNLQGYFFGRPVDAGSLANLLKRRASGTPRRSAAQRSAVKEHTA